MGIFGFGKKKEPVQASKPEPKPQPIPKDLKPYQHMYMVDGQWYVNPNYDPTAPKPPKVQVFGLDDDEDEEDDD